MGRGRSPPGIGFITWEPTEYNYYLQLFAHSALYCDGPFPSRPKLQLFAHSVLYCDGPFPSHPKLQLFAHSVLYCDGPFPSRPKLQLLAHSVLYCDGPFPINTVQTNKRIFRFTTLILNEFYLFFNTY